MNKYKNTSKKGKRAIRIRWRKYEERLANELKKRQSLQNSDIHLARICGFLAGDGAVYKYAEKTSIHYNIYFYPDHESMAKLFVESFKFLYSLIPQVKKEKNHYRIRITSKLIFNHLTSINNFGTLKWTVPLKIVTTKKLKKEWIRAFFDCEASVSKTQIQVQSVNSKGISQIRDLLNEFEIESKIYQYERKNPKWNTNYILSIMKKESRKRYLKEIGFNHTIKQIKLLKQCQGA